jgi:hypothetical protein
MMLRGSLVKLRSNAALIWTAALSLIQHSENPLEQLRDPWGGRLFSFLV